MSDIVFDPSVKKKKKSSKPSFITEDESASSAATSEAAAPTEKVQDLSLESGEFEFKKKKKKSKSQAASAVDDFEAALQEAGVSPEATAAAKETEKNEANTLKGLEVKIGYVGHQDEITYEAMVDRFFEILRINNPEMASDRQGVKYKIPPPVVLRDGKKTLFANIKSIASKMHRSSEHVIQFLFAELGTSGSVDGAQRLVIKGKFQQKAIEGVLRRYIIEYVTCKTCKSVNTRLMKENRLYFLECNSCGSRRSVQSIKTGYQAVTRDARKKAHAAT